MKIAINGYEAVVPRFGYDINGLPVRVGSGAYAFELICNLNKIDRSNDYLIYLPVIPTKDMPRESEKWEYKVIKARKLWTITALSPEFLKRPKIDVFFTPTHYLPPFVPNNSIISILDVSYLKFPQLFKRNDLIKLKKWGEFSINKARRIVTISESSKNDIIEAYGVPEDKVVVTYPGISKVIKPILQINSKYKMQNSKYILSVGTVQPRKNFEKLIEAFSKLKGTDLDLVIVGKLGWKYEEILSAPKKYGVEDRVKFLHNVRDEELPGFYKNAAMFVLPSLYEGFGLPVLEAMQYEAPVITSNVSSLPEVGGDAVIYVDPTNVEDIASKMQKLIEDENLRKELISKGKKQVEKFSWEKTARDTLKVFEEVANG